MAENNASEKPSTSATANEVAVDDDHYSTSLHSPSLPSPSSTEEDDEQQQEKLKSSKIYHYIPPPHALQLKLHLKKSKHLTNTIKHATVRSILFHLLYARGVIPCPVVELMRCYEEYCSSSLCTAGAISNDLMEGVENEKKQNGSKTRGTGFGGWCNKRIEKKAMKCAQALSSLLNDIASLFTDEDEKNDDNKTTSCCNVKSVLITLGPSFVSPREQYVIRFCNDPQYTNDAAMSSMKIPMERMEQELTKRFVREFLHSTSINSFYSDMFHPRKKRRNGGSGNGGLSGIKVNVAILVDKATCQGIFGQQQELASDGDAPTMPDEHWNGSEPTSWNGNQDYNSMYSFPSWDGGTTTPYYFGSMGTTTTAATTTSSAEFSSATSFQNLLSNRLMVRHNFTIRTPRMISKKRGKYRPYIVVDLFPTLLPSSFRKGNSNDDNDDECVPPSPLEEDGDVWMSFRSTLKGFCVGR